MHNVPYTRHPGYQKTIATAKSQYYWSLMKKEVVEFIAKFLACQKVKVEHRYLDSFLQPLSITEWKWEVVTMDFITKLPITNKHHDSSMLVVDKLTKSTHFIPVNLTHNEAKIVDIYLREISRLHGMPNTIVSDRDPKFTSNFWKGLFKGFGENIHFITTYHLESYGQIERVNQVIEDMVRMYVMDKPSRWE
jgi:hypothetical protein